MDEEKKTALKNVETTEISTLNPHFQQIVNYKVQFLVQKWVKRRHFFIDQKNLQRIFLAEEVSSD